MSRKACLCSSGLDYSVCCRIYHKQEQIADPEALMRSRYSAYALGLSDYIIATTHPQHKDFSSDTQSWAKQLQIFMQQTYFYGLQVLAMQQVSPQQAHVIFKAFLSQGQVDVSFQEKSLFIFEKGRWLYQEALEIKAIS